MEHARSGREQDEDWARRIAGWRRDGFPPFASQWDTYRETFEGRPAEAGAPVAWRPTPERIEHANATAWMRELGLPDWAAFHRWSAEHREEFWSRVVRDAVVFSRPASRALGNPDRPKAPRWLDGARFNIVDSCFRGAPDAPAVVVGRESETSLRHVTAGELETLVNRVANGLHERGFRAGDRIALYLPMTLECVAAYLGIIRAGCVVVSVADSFSSAELAKRLEIAEANGIVTVDVQHRGGRTLPMYAKVVEAAAPRAVVIPGGADSPPPLREGDLPWEALLTGDTSFVSRPAAPDDPVNILFSSGTTGTPKAIPWTHLTPLKGAMDGRFHQDIHAGDVVAWPTNIGWMMGPWLIFASLVNGAAIALYEGAPNADGFPDFVERAGVTMLGVVPSLVTAWRRGGSLRGRRWSTVRTFSSTGEPSNVPDYLWLMSRTDYRAPVIEYLGGTEIGGGHITGSVLQAASPSTFTTPALGLDFALLAPDGTAVPEGEGGELFLIPPSIGLSERLLNADHDRVYYEGAPPAPDGGILRRHGDRFVRDAAGFYRTEGRVDDTMNLGGIKIGSLELERALNGHPAVSECAAVGIRPPEGGAERLHVFVVPAGDPPPDPSALRSELDRRLASRLNPLFRVHRVVLVDSLPRTASNKLMRRKLQAPPA